MNNQNIKTALSVKKKTAAVLIALAAAFVLPQICHIVGAVSGLGTSVGEALLPMQLPILLVGFYAGAIPGAVAGALAPLVSALITGMPHADLLPFMMIELCTYGITCGLLRKVKMPTVVKVLSTQLAGRAIRAAAILVSFYLIGLNSVSPDVILSSITAGIFGIILQLIIVPLAVRASEKE